MAVIIPSKWVCNNQLFNKEYAWILNDIFRIL